MASHIRPNGPLLGYSTISSAVGGIDRFPVSSRTWLVRYFSLLFFCKRIPMAFDATFFCITIDSLLSFVFVYCLLVFKVVMLFLLLVQDCFKYDFFEVMF